MLKRISSSRQYAPLRVCADICFFYYFLAVISLFSARAGLIAPLSLQISMFVAACFIVGFVTVRVDSPALRFALSLLPGLCFFIRFRFEPEMIIPMSAWLYYIIVTTLGNFDVHLDIYRRRVTAMLIISLLCVMCFVTEHVSLAYRNGGRLVAGEIYGLIFFVLAVLSLRGMRCGLGAPGEMKLFDAASVVGLPALLVGAGALVFVLLRAASPAFSFIFAPLVRFLTWLFLKLFPNEGAPEVTAQPNVGFSNLQNINPYKDLLEEQLNENVVQHNDDDYSLSAVEAPSYLGIVILLAVVIVIIVFLAVKNSRRSDDGELTEYHYQYDNGKVRPERRSRRRRDDGPNSAQLRRVYRSFLEIVDSRQDVEPADTSQDVLDYSSEYFDIPENEALRDLYIAARYGDPDAVTKEQLNEAKRCLSMIEEKNSQMADQQISSEYDEYETSSDSDYKIEHGGVINLNTKYGEANSSKSFITASGKGGVLFRKRKK